MKIPHCLPAVLVCLLLGSFPRAAVPPAEVLAAAQAAPNGLSVQVGADDAAFLGDLSLGGKRLVHGLTLRHEVQNRMLAELIRGGSHPHATVSLWTSAPILPYADRLVTFLIVDRDALGAGAPSLDECRRVVQPGGVLLMREKGVWTSQGMPRPESLGDWTHFDGGADGNAVSTDREATAMRGLQWIDNVREFRWAKSGPHGGEGGNTRILGRYAVLDMRIFPEDKDPKFAPRYHLECRDVNNGLLIWRKPRPNALSAKRWSLAVAQGQCFTWLTEDGALTAIDLATGRELRNYPGSEIKPWLGEEHGNPPPPPKLKKGMLGNNHQVRVAGNVVLATGDGALRAWDIDGTPRWVFQREGHRLDMPVVDEKRGTVCGLLIRDQIINKWNKGPVIWGRWTSSASVASLVAIDLKTGALRWENTDVASRETDVRLFNQKANETLSFGQVLVAGDHVIAFNSKAIMGGSCAFIASIDAATGKTVHLNPRTLLYTTPHGRLESLGAYCVLARDEKVYLMAGFSIYTYDPQTGALDTSLEVSWNARCQKPVATRDHFLLGQTAFVDKSFAGEMFALARSGCAHSPVPGAGVIVFGPHMCACTTHLDGFLATTSRPAPVPFADAKRLMVYPDTEARPFPSDAMAPAASLISEAWPWFTISTRAAPVTRELSGWTFDVLPLGHRVTARKGERSWTFVADARIGEGFAVIGNRAVFASHDGWVHGVDLETGARRWSHLVAPSQRLIVANGMLTSSWPVFGVADIGNGQVFASAGLHTELDGGIRMVALNAADGSPVWVKTLRKPSSVLPPGGGRETKIHDRSVINAVPEFTEGKIVLAGGAHLGRVEFEPTESEDSINARLNAMPARKR